MIARAGHYLLERPLDSGGMSQLWEGVGPDGVRVAVKTLTPSAADHADQHEALLAEAALLAELDHTHVVRFVGQGVLDSAAPAPLQPGAPWFATELARGGTLAPLAGRVPWRRARRLLEQLLSALSYLHGEGVLHLDLKPSNVLLAGPDHVRLCDFGLARPLWERARPSDWGTPAYMAPEQLRDPPGRANARTDLYSFGCVAWTLLTGRPPFGRAPEEASINHLYGAMPCLPEGLQLPDEAARWLRSLIQRSPAKRPTSADEALKTLLAMERTRSSSGWMLFPSEVQAVPTLKVVSGVG